MHIQRSLDQTLSTFEQGLNAVGYIPLVSTFSGALRINYGKLEVIGAVAAASIMAVKALFNPDAADRYRELNRAVEVLFTYTLHGLANIIRGIIEVFPFVSLATCLPYDLLENRFSYPTEKNEPFGMQSPLFSPEM